MLVRENNYCRQLDSKRTLKSRVLLFNPPGKILIRGEGRSDSETDPETSCAAAKWIYPPMNLAYGAACLRNAFFDPVIRDYPAQRGSIFEFRQELLKLKPGICVVNLNPSSEADDLKALKVIREELPECGIIAYAPYLSLYELSELPAAVIDSCDVIVTAEYPQALVFAADILLSGRRAGLKAVKGILYRDTETGSIVKTSCPAPCDLNELPLPARDLMNNNLYVRPDNGRPQALVQTGRGCPFNCAFCLAPSLTGREFTQRSVESVLEEVRSCVNSYGIDQFFFRADTFTVNRSWVEQFSRNIIDSGLNISWCANSRADRVDKELLGLMRKSGCWLLAFGFESGAPETLKKVNKGVTVEDNEEASRLCREQKIKVHGQYIIGFPWEGRRHLEQTYAHIKRARCDFVDVQVLVPYKGTAIHKDMRANCPELIDALMGSKIHGGITGTSKGLTKKDLILYQKIMLRAAYLSPYSLLKKILEIRSFREFRNYARYGLKFIMNSFFGS